MGVIAFKVLVERTKGKDKGKKVWFYAVAVGSGMILQDWRILAPVKDPLSPPLQYIGIDDRNGTEIYEGDIVRLKKAGVEMNGDLFLLENEVFVIERIGTCFGIKVYGGERTYYLKDILYEEIEVIGNIYEKV